MIEIELMRVAILVANEEVAFFITQKLRPLAVCQARIKVRFQGGFLSQQQFVELRKRVVLRMKASRFADRLVNCPGSSFDIDRRLGSRSCRQLRSQTRATVRIQKVPEQKQIEMGGQIQLLHFTLF